MKPITTRVHGIIDYATATLMHAIPYVLKWDRKSKASKLLECSSATGTAYSLLTRYEYGVVRVLPMKAHLTLDALTAGTHLAAAALLVDEDDDVRLTLAGLGMFELAATLLTQTRPSECIAGRSRAARVEQMPTTDLPGRVNTPKGVVMAGDQI